MSSDTRTRFFLAVDDELCWRLRVPQLVPWQSREASPAALSELGGALDAQLAAAELAPLAASIVARVVAGLACDEPPLPPLPFIGEPFGGEGGTD